MTPWLEPGSFDPVPRPVKVENSTLPDPVVTRPGGEWRLEAAYLYRDGPVTITVPQGFMFDLASVPRWLWPITAPFELSIVGPLLHDFMYRARGLVAEHTDPPTAYTRWDADRIFLAAMAAEGVKAWRRYPAWLAVRAFGGLAWG